MPYIPFPESPLFNSRQEYLAAKSRFTRNLMGKGTQREEAEREWKHYLKITGRYWPAGPFGPSWDSFNGYNFDKNLFIEDNIRSGITRNAAEKDWKKRIKNTAILNKWKYHDDPEYKRLLEIAIEKRQKRLSEEEKQRPQKESEERRRKQHAASTVLSKKLEREKRRGLPPHLWRRVR